MATTITTTYAASAAVTISLAPAGVGLATSSTFVAGRESTIVDNTSNKYVDVLLAGKITVGTTPTINTQILIYVFGTIDDGPEYPDVMDGTDSAETVTSVGVGAGFLKLAAAILVDATTSDRVYAFGPVALAQLFGGVMPNRWGVFVTHNTGVALNATGSNHEVNYWGITYTNT